MSSDETLKFNEIFEEISKTMRSDFERSRFAIQIHPSLKGEAAENIVRKFLESYIPNSLGITGGILVDSNGKRSKQLDVIIYDAEKTPIFFQSDNIRVIPVECAYSVIEVKSKLDSDELPTIFKNMDSVRNLEKKAFYTETDIPPFSLYGRTWDHWPINYFVFAFDSIGLDTLVSNINEIQTNDSRNPEQKIDMICVLDKGVIHYTDDGDDYCITPKSTSQLQAAKTSKSLLLFYSLISRLLNQMNMKKFTFTPYISEIDFELQE